MVTCQDWNGADEQTLEEELAQAREDVADLARHLEHAREVVAELEAMRPPFKPGQHAQLKTLPEAGVLVVEGCARAFGQWVVAAHWARLAPGLRAHANFLTFADRLEAVVAQDEEDDEVPF